MLLPTTALLASLALLPAAHAGYWGLSFFESNNCTPPSPAGFGDSMTYGCTAIGTNAKLLSASSPNYDGSFQVQVYTSDDCSGDPCFLGTGCCVDYSGAGWKAYRAFAR